MRGGPASLMNFRILSDVGFLRKVFATTIRGKTKYPETAKEHEEQLRINLDYRGDSSRKKPQ